MPDLDPGSGPGHDLRLPSHHDTGSSGSEPIVGGKSRSRGALLIVGAVGLVVLMLVLHLTGVVGAGSH